MQIQEPTRPANTTNTAITAPIPLMRCSHFGRIVGCASEPELFRLASTSIYIH